MHVCRGRRLAWTSVCATSSKPFQVCGRPSADTRALSRSYSTLLRDRLFVAISRSSHRRERVGQVAVRKDRCGRRCCLHSFVRPCTERSAASRSCCSPHCCSDRREHLRFQRRSRREESWNKCFRKLKSTFRFWSSPTQLHQACELAQTSSWPQFSERASPLRST